MVRRCEGAGGRNTTAPAVTTPEAAAAILDVGTTSARDANARRTMLPAASARAARLGAAIASTLPPPRSIGHRESPVLAPGTAHLTWSVAVIVGWNVQL